MASATRFRGSAMVDQEWLETCVTAGEFLYGIYPAAVLEKLYERKKGCSISSAQIRECVEKSGAIMMEYVEGALLDTGEYAGSEGFLYPVQAKGQLRKVMERADRDGNPYAANHLSEDEHIELLRMQEDVEFYIPSEHEISELVENGCIRTPEMNAFEAFVKKAGGDPAFLLQMWPLVSTDRLDTMEALQYAISHAFPGGRAPSMEEANRAVARIQDYLNSINLRGRRGWAPNALLKKMGPLKKMSVISPGSVHAAKMFREMEPQLQAMGAKVDYSSIDTCTTIGEYGERRVVKVGRNDPCPCGSGLKYKRCHGK